MPYFSSEFVWLQSLPSHSCCLPSLLNSLYVPGIFSPKFFCPIVQAVLNLLQKNRLCNHVPNKCFPSGQVTVPPFPAKHLLPFCILQKIRTSVAHSIVTLSSLLVHAQESLCPPGSTSWDRASSFLHPSGSAWHPVPASSCLHWIWPW